MQANLGHKTTQRTDAKHDTNIKNQTQILIKERCSNQSLKNAAQIIPYRTLARSCIRASIDSHAEAGAGCLGIASPRELNSLKHARVYQSLKRPLQQSSRVRLAMMPSAAVRCCCGRGAPLLLPGLYSCGPASGQILFLLAPP